MFDVDKFIDELSFSLKEDELRQEDVFLEQYRLTPLESGEEDHEWIDR